jgi:hypothetical protein
MLGIFRVHNWLIGCNFHNSNISDNKYLYKNSCIRIYHNYKRHFQNKPVIKINFLGRIKSWRMSKNDSFFISFKLKYYRKSVGCNACLVRFGTLAIFAAEFWTAFTFPFSTIPTISITFHILTIWIAFWIINFAELTRKPFRAFTFSTFTIASTSTRTRIT